MRAHAPRPRPRRARAPRPTPPCVCDQAPLQLGRDCPGSGHGPSSGARAALTTTAPVSDRGPESIFPPKPREGGYWARPHLTPQQSVSITVIAIAIGLGRRKIVVYKMTASKLITDERFRHDMDSHYTLLFFPYPHAPHQTNSN